MKKIILYLFLILLLTGCSTNESETRVELEKIKSLETNIIGLIQSQDTLIEEVSILSEQVKDLEAKLVQSEEKIETINMDLLSLSQVNDIQDELFISMINETARLYGYGKIEEKLYLINAYDFESNIISVLDKHNEITEYEVSEDCKVLVAGLYSIIYQDLEEGRGFIESTIGDPVHKVIIILKNGIVEQIQMYGAGAWW